MSKVKDKIKMSTGHTIQARCSKCQNRLENRREHEANTPADGATDEHFQFVFVARRNKCRRLSKFLFRFQSTISCWTASSVVRAYFTTIFLCHQTSNIRRLRTSLLPQK